MRQWVVCVNSIIMVAWIQEILLIFVLQSAVTLSMYCTVWSSFPRLTYSVSRLPLSDIILVLLIANLDSRTFWRLEFLIIFKGFICSVFLLFAQNTITTFLYCSILRLKNYLIYQQTVGHGRYSAVTRCLTFLLMHLDEDNIAILGGVSALICGICFSFPFEGSAVRIHYLLVGWLSCSSTPSPTGGVCAHSSRWHTQNTCIVLLMKQQYSPLYLIDSMFRLLNAVVVRSTRLSLEYTPAAHMPGKLPRLITAGAIMGLNVENSHFHYDVE